MSSERAKSGLGALSSIEVRSIDYVPENERHGTVRGQTPFWFLGNFQFFTIAVGFVGPGMGLSFFYSALAGALGILIGTLFMAFHASQGPELGLPQMIQSRAQFGYRGVLLPLAGTLITFIAFNVVDTVLSTQGLTGIFGLSPLLLSIVIAIVAAVLAIFGHDLLHLVFKSCFAVALPLFFILTAALIFGFGGAQKIVASVPHGFTWVAFLAQLSAAASYNISYAPYVSDYTRYLPRHTSRGAIIASVFVGASFSGIWLLTLGAWLAVSLGASDGLVALNQAGNAVFPYFGAVLSIVSVVAMVATMGLNAYSGMLTVLTMFDSVKQIKSTRTLRIATILVLTVAWVALAAASSSNAITLLGATLSIMLYLLVPWTSVNLVDYFVVRHGRYAVADFFTPRGIYGAWGVQGIVSYIVAFVCVIPFMVLPDIYEGPIARRISGVDVGWVVGLAVAGGLYFILSKTKASQDEGAAIARSQKALDEAARDSALHASASS